MTFFRFPHTPHLEWLGEGDPRDDKVLAPPEVEALLAHEVVVEEKIDGANVGFSISADGDLRAQNRGQYLIPPYDGQFEKLNGWILPLSDRLFDVLGADLILFGEWCTARHSIYYDRLPDWFVIFDVYDRKAEKFYSVQCRNRLAQQLGLHAVPLLASGYLSLAILKELVTTHPSRYREGPLEGVVVRCEEGDWSLTRAKLVNAAFTQNIGEHWRKRSLQWNRLDEDRYSHA